MVADILRLQACLSGAASPLFRPWSNAAGGVSPPRVFPRHPLPQIGKLDEKMRRMKQKLVPLDPRASRPSGPIPPLLEIPLALRCMIWQIPFLIPACPNRADNHSAFSCAKDPASPTRRGLAIWRCHFRHGPEGGRDKLPIRSARSIVASVSAGQQVGKYTIIDGCY